MVQVQKVHPNNCLGYKGLIFGNRTTEVGTVSFQDVGTTHRRRDDTQFVTTFVKRTSLNKLRVVVVVVWPSRSKCTICEKIRDGAPSLVFTVPGLRGGHIRTCWWILKCINIHHNSFHFVPFFCFSLRPQENLYYRSLQQRITRPRTYFTLSSGPCETSSERTTTLFIHTLDPIVTRTVLLVVPIVPVPSLTVWDWTRVRPFNVTGDRLDVNPTGGFEDVVGRSVLRGATTGGVTE